MVRILFVCHGNVCRSPMAKFIMEHLVRSCGLEKCVMISSGALSYEAVGNPMYHAAQAVLWENGIPIAHHSSKKIRRSSYSEFEYIIGMDEENRRALNRLFRKDPCGKIHLLLDFSPEPRPVADPWYTKDFGRAYEDIYTGCGYLLDHIKNEINWGTGG